MMERQRVGVGEGGEVVQGCRGEVGGREVHRERYRERERVCVYVCVYKHVPM